MCCHWPQTRMLLEAAAETGDSREVILDTHLAFVMLLP